MTFNFKAAQAQAQSQMNNKALFAIILGASGAGKSSVIGTMGGKVLFIFGSGESHGPKAAAALGGEVIPVCTDVGDDGKQLTPDEAYARLLDILSDPAAIKAEKFTTVAVDGAPELEAILLKSKKFEAMITNEKGRINSFLKSESMSVLMREVVMGLKKVHAAGLNVVMTCRADVKSLADDGSVDECSPKLSSFGVAESLIAQFDDVLLVGAVNSGGKHGYAFQFGKAISKVSKDLEGTVKRILNFSPRVTGAKIVSEYLKADLKLIVELKNPVKEEKK